MASIAPPIATLLIGPGRELKAPTPADTASVTAVKAGSKAINKSAPNAPIFPLSIASLSLYSSAFCANAVVILTDSLSIASPPMLSIGIISAPDLPKYFKANAVFATPSGICLNLLAISSITESAALSFPFESVTFIPNALKAATCCLLPTLASSIDLLSLTIALATESISVPLVDAAFLKRDSDSTLTPVD